jgi:hypothetical protein
MKIALTILSFAALVSVAFAAGELTETACIPPAVAEAIA